MPRTFRHNDITRSDRVPMLVGLAQMAPFQHVPAMPFPFVGRIQEQEQVRIQLARLGIVGITGIGGSGKTSLAVSLLHETNTSVVWIEIWPKLNDQIDSFLWQLAQPLAQATPHIWRALHYVQQSQWGYPPLVRLHMILDAYVALGKQITICVDRLEQLTDQALESAVAELCEYIRHMQRNQINLIAVGRELPYALHGYAMQELQGLEVQAVTHWIQQLGIDLDMETIATLQRQTAGLPQPINLVLRSLLNGTASVILDPIAAHQEIRSFVARLLNDFSEEEQEFLAMLVREQGINMPLSLSALRYLNHLERNHMTIVSSTNIVRAHPMVQHFFQFYGV